MPKESTSKRTSPKKATYGATSKYINETQEQMCIGLTKKIVVVDFLPKEDRDIISPSNKFCEQNLDIKYDIEYVPIPYMSNDSFSKMKEFPAVKSIDNCVSIIIHARTNGDKEIKDNLLSFLDTFKPLRNTTVIFDDTASEFPTIVSKGYLDRHCITGVKFLNVMIQNWNSIERFVSDNKTLLYVPPKYYNINPPQFECKWWFKYYIDKAFDCGKGRLVQYAGTCYLNSAINGIILSDTAHRIALMYMNKELQSNPLLLSQIKQDITGLSCLVSKRSTSVSILYRILYNIFCKYDKVLTLDKRAGGKPLDIIIKSSQQLFSPANNPSDLDYGEGGFSEHVLYTLFFEMKSKFVVNFDQEFYNPVISLPADGFFGYINLLPVSSDEDILNADFLLYIYDPSKALFSDALPIIQIGPTKFDLEFSQISLKFSKDDFHEICGYICDGNYKIFDSASNIIETVEWNNLSNPDIRTYMEKTLAFAWTKNVVVEGMTSIVYINSNKKYSYHDTGVCPSN